MHPCSTYASLGLCQVGATFIYITYPEIPYCTFFPFLSQDATRYIVHSQQVSLEEHENLVQARFLSSSSTASIGAPYFHTHAFESKRYVIIILPMFLHYLVTNYFKNTSVIACLQFEFFAGKIFPCQFMQKC